MILLREATSSRHWKGDRGQDLKKEIGAHPAGEALVRLHLMHRWRGQVRWKFVRQQSIDRRGGDILLTEIERSLAFLVISRQHIQSDDNFA
jgi:hypothetical protein